MPQTLSRRRFLKAAGLSAAALATARSAGRVLAQEPNPQTGTTYDYNDPTNVFNEIYGNPPMLGRVHGASWLRVFREPSPRASSFRRVNWGFVMPLYEAVHGERYDARAHSSIWFKTHEGYVHSAYVVPCREQHQPTVTSWEGDGFWGEVSVPISWQFQRPSLRSHKWDFAHYQAFWGQVHKVVEAAEDEDGRVWYRLYDDEEENRPAWVLGHHIRRIDPGEFAPIHPNVEGKHVDINLAQQMLRCYEGDDLVFHTRIASGTSFENDEGTLVNFQTLQGDYNIERKRPSRRMRGGSDVGLPYDVNGVPWCTYFGNNGAAIHGAYWHNNYGLPRSHGCINVTPDAAKWIYRWTAPHLDYEDEYYERTENEPTTIITVT